MKQSGQIVLVPFPFTDLSGAKLRPVLMLRQASIQFDDWLVCMVSSQLRQTDAQIDEILSPSDPDFAATGLKVPSVLRLSRLAVLEGSLLIGSLGSISDERLQRIRQQLAAWIVEGGDE
ncbi:type II toxin-antitoxin system PemK/MazF family toxin [Leptolyngbya sp. AN03gr2]|uniref:type II toxin-antitoxin system PemK/MazF family toxin n=1 Tax=unclassified Leptolyngbya TaxID=2650499 RepID=UPI003D313BD6